MSKSIPVTSQIQTLLGFIWLDYQRRKDKHGKYSYGYEGVGNAQLAVQLGIFDKGEGIYRRRIEQLMTRAVPVFAETYPGYSLHRDGGGLARVVMDADDPKPYRSVQINVRTAKTKVHRARAMLNHIPKNSSDPAQLQHYAEIIGLDMLLQTITDRLEAIPVTV